MKTAQTMRGRPRCFDVDQAVGVAQRLFQERGYDGVGVAALTKALGINPPSFYAAFGSKAGLFEQVLDRYQRERLPHAPYLSSGTTPAEALRGYLEAAALTFADDAKAAGCLILESARGGGGAESTELARRRKRVTRDAIVAFLRPVHSQKAEPIADFVVATTTGMSAAAREGATADGLLETATIAGDAIAASLADQPVRA